MKTIQDFIKHNIEVLGDKYHNAFPIFGGALWVYHDNDFDSQRFIAGLSHVAEDAEFFKWHEGVAGVCTWSVPGCSISFAHDLMLTYFDSKRN